MNDAASWPRTGLWPWGWPCPAPRYRAHCRGSAHKGQMCHARFAGHPVKHSPADQSSQRTCSPDRTEYRRTDYRSEPRRTRLAPSPIASRRCRHTCAQAQRPDTRRRLRSRHHAKAGSSRAHSPCPRWSSDFGVFAPREKRCGQCGALHFRNRTSCPTPLARHYQSCAFLCRQNRHHPSVHARSTSRSAAQSRALVRSVLPARKTLSQGADSRTVAIPCVDPAPLARGANAALDRRMTDHPPHRTGWHPPRGPFVVSRAAKDGHGCGIPPRPHRLRTV